MSWVCGLDYASGVVAATLIVRRFRFGLGWAGFGRAWLDQVMFVWCWHERIPRS